jgi:hypothetical protein
VFCIKRLYFDIFYTFACLILTKYYLNFYFNTKNRFVFSFYTLFTHSALNAFPLIQRGDKMIIEKTKNTFSYKNLVDVP